MVSGKETRLKILAFLSKNGQKHSSQVAKAFGLSNDSAYHHLMVLASDGLVSKQQISERVILWKITDEGLSKVKHKK